MPQHTLPSEEALREYYVGKDLNDAPKPSAVLDAAIIKRHCEQMLRTMKSLNVGFRAHVKTHKVGE
jgi:D-serine deaminase-like pyridoxal phosphate-dependent protein